MNVLVVTTLESNNLSKSPINIDTNSVVIYLQSCHCYKNYHEAIATFAAGYFTNRKNIENQKWKVGSTCFVRRVKLSYEQSFFLPPIFQALKCIKKCHMLQNCKMNKKITFCADCDHCACACEIGRSKLRIKTQNWCKNINSKNIGSRDTFLVFTSSRRNRKPRFRLLLMKTIFRLNFSIPSIQRKVKLKAVFFFFCFSLAGISSPHCTWLQSWLMLLQLQHAHLS